MKWIGQNIWDQVSRFRDDVHLIDHNDSSASGGPVLNLTQEDGAAIALDHRMGKITFNAAEDSIGTLRQGASIEAFATGNWSSTQNGTRLEFYTKQGDNVRELSLKLDSDRTATFANTIKLDKESSSGSTGGALLRLRQDDGAAMANNDRLGGILFQGAEDSSNNIQTGAKISAYAEDDWSGTENGCRLEFYTMDGNASSELSLKLDSDLLATFSGGVTVGGTLTVDSVGISAIQTSGESFVDNDTSLMTSAAILDKIQATASGDITGVVLTADDSNTVSDTGGSADFTIQGSNGITTAIDTHMTISGVNASASAKGVVELATTAETTTGTDTSRAVTPDGLKDGYQGSTNVTTLGTISTGTWNGTAIGASYVATLNQDTTGQAGTVATIAGLAPNTATTQATQPNITTLSGLTSLGSAGATTDIAAGDLTMYNAVNDGNPTISLGSSATERLEIRAEYESGAQGLDIVKFITHTAGSAANDSRYAFQVDETFILSIKDAGIQIKASGALEIGSGNTILSDSSGTTTLSNIDALDATTESTIETAIDTLSNLTTVGTIGTGTWQGTAIATGYTKHLVHYEFRGYATGDGTNYEIPVLLTDNQAPWEHNTSTGSDGLTAITVQTQIRMGGQTMPTACTLKKWTGWSTCAGSATAYIGLFKLTPVRNNSSDRSLVLLKETSFTALGNAKAEDFAETSFDNDSIAAGDILVTGVKCGSGNALYFTSSIEVEF